MNRFALAGFVVGLLIALAPSCGGPRPCTASNCRGCCQSDGVCELGQALGACGSGGAACLSCSGGQACTAGLCEGGGGGMGGGGQSGGGAGGGGGAMPVDAGSVDQRMRLFVTSSEYTGALGGLAGGDALCQTAAVAANKGGTWKAWLSSSTENAIDRMADVGPWYQEPASGEWVKTFNNKANLVTSPLAQLFIDEQGRGNINTTGPSYWTGTAATGKADVATCGSWSSTVSYGTRGPGSGSWSAHSVTSRCDSTYALVCLEQAKLPAPTAQSSTRKRLFVTSSEYTGALGGLAGGDSLCQTAAAAANKGGTWKAWLSSSTENAIDRMADVGPWYQEPASGEWVKTFNNKANLVTSPLAQLFIDEQGRGNINTTGPSYWTGTAATGKADVATCGSWSSTVSYGTRGPGSGSWSAHSVTSRCDSTYALVCFEQ